MPQGISRRGLIQTLAGAAATLRSRSSVAQDEGGAAQPSGMRRVHRIDNSFALAVSPDASRICVDYTSNQLLRILPGSAQNRFKRERLRVFDTASWKEIASAPIPAWAGAASFFADSGRVYFETLLIEPANRQFNRGVIDLADDRVQQSVATWDGEGPNTIYHALSGEELLGVVFRSSTLVALQRASWPNLREIDRVPISWPPGEKRPGGSPTTSADRSTALYVLGHLICMRRTADLSLVWTRRIDPGFYGAGPLSITPNGSLAAISVLGYEVKAQKSRDYIGIYNGGDGSIVREVPVSGRFGLAISPDGSLIAVGRRSSDGPYLELVIDVCETQTAARVASGVHDRIPPGRYQHLLGNGFNLSCFQFTPDGQYLVTSSSSNVAIWKIG